MQTSVIVNADQCLETKNNSFLGIPIIIAKQFAMTLGLGNYLRNCEPL